MAVILILWLVAGSLAEPGGAPLQSVPHPDLSSVEGSVRQVLEAARSDLDSGLSSDGSRVSAGSDPLDLARRFGELGRLYHGFEMEGAAAVCYANAWTLAPSEPQWTYVAGLLALENRRLAEAVEWFDRTLALLPGHPTTLIRSGETRRLMGRSEAAADFFRRALDAVDQPETPNAGLKAAALFGLGRLANGSSDSARAVEYLEAAAKLAPDSGAVQQQLMLAYRRAKRLDDARGAASRSGPSLPTFDDPWGRGVLPTSGATARLLLGNAALRAGRLESALAHHREARRLAPEDPAAARALALTLETLGRADEAIEAYDRAVRLAPEEVVYLYDWARMRLKKTTGDEEAIDALKRVVESAPDFLNGHLLLASSQMSQGNVERAEAGLKRALELSPGEPRALRALAGLRVREAEQHLASGDREAAIDALEEAVDLSPGDLQLRLDLARLSLSMGRHGEAGRHLAQLESRPPAAPELRLQMVELQLQAGREARAAEMLSAWLQAEPTPVVQRLAASLFAAGSGELRNPRRAVALAQRAFELEPTPEGAEVVALALASAGAFESAIQWQARLLEQMQRLQADPAFLRRLAANLDRYRAAEPGRASWQSAVEP